MIKLISGDIFETNAFFIVNPVNVIGIMGAGLAKKMKEKHPLMFSDYRRRCYYNILALKDPKKAKEAKKNYPNSYLRIGKVLYYNVGVIKGRNYKYIISFPTKEHYKDNSEYRYIRKGLENYMSTYKAHAVTSVAFPLLGAGLGNLNEKKVLKIMLEYLKDSIVDVYIYVNEDLIRYGNKVLKGMNK